MHLITFDIDGTLVDSEGFDSRLYVQAIREVLEIRIDDDWTRYRHVTDSGILEEILEGHQRTEKRDRIRAAVKTTFVRLVAEHLEASGGVLPEISGATKFLDRLAAYPTVAVAVATGGWRETALMKLRAIGLRPERLSLASASDSVSRTEIMRLAAERALGGRRARRRSYFGDGPWDKTASTQLGFDFVAIGGKVPHAPSYIDYTAADKILEELGLCG
jgi:beta-phosphoglucomutase-like phosphatase (HAD superfamily)